jgi:hypothetical protein
MRLPRFLSTSLFVSASIAGVLVVSLGTYAYFGGVPKPVDTVSVDLQKGLLGHWKLDGNFKDATPYGRNGTASGVSFGADRKAKAASAVNLTGSTCVSIPSFNVANQITLSIWMNPTQVTVGKKLLGKHSGAADIQGTLGLNGNKPWFELTTGGVYRSTVVSPNPVSAGVWTLVTGTYDGSSMKLYVNGALVYTEAASGAIATNALPWNIGSTNWCNPGANFSGLLDDARIYNRALSAAEVSALFRTYDGVAKLGSGEKNLVGWWKLDGNGKDSSPYGNNATSITNATPVADRKGTAAGAYNFSGVGSNGFQVSNSSSLQPSDKLSISAWVRYGTGSMGIYQMILSKANGSFGYELNKSSSNALRFEPTCADGTSHRFNEAAGSLSTTGVWYHVAATFDATTGDGQLFVNGQPRTVSYIDARAPCVGGFGVNTGPLTLGSRSWTGSPNMTGDLDDVRLYTRVLSAAEVAAQYRAYSSQVSIGSLQKGLIGYWPMNGNAKDATVYGNNLTNTAVTATTDRKGRANSAYLFNGTSSSLLTAPTSNLNIAGNMTMAAWIRPTNIHGFINSAAPIVQKRLLNADTCCIFDLRSGGGIGTSWRSVSGGWKSVNSNSGIIPVGVWSHVVAVRGLTQTDLYVNGVRVTTSPQGTSDAVPNTQHFNIGGGTSGAYSYFPGSIDDVLVYNRALSALEVMQLYREYR